MRLCFLLGQAGLPQERSFTHRFGHIAASELAKNSAKLPGPMQNPLLDLTFPVPFDAIREEHIEPAVRTRLAEAHAAIDAIAASTGPLQLRIHARRARTRFGTAGASDVPGRAFGEREHHARAARSVQRGAARRERVRFEHPAQPRPVARAERVREDPRGRELSIRFGVACLDKTLADFRRSGAQLDDEKKERLKAIDSELSLITTRFSQNVLDSSNEFEILIEDEAALIGLARVGQSRRAGQRPAKGQVRLSLHAASAEHDGRAHLLGGCKRSASGSGARKAPSPPRASTTTERSSRASWSCAKRRQTCSASAILPISSSTIAWPKRARTRSASCMNCASARELAFERENRELLAFRRELEGPDAPALQPWDVTYYSEKLRKARFSLDEEELREYFPAELAVQGAFTVAERLYGVRIEQLEGVPVWDPAVRAYRIVDESNDELGTFYVDLYPRENKRSGAWMHGLIATVPPAPNLAVFCLNASPPSGGKPSLLLHRDVETLFHEFGHLLHHCLSRVPVRSLAGTRVAQDFVELPSQIMENWCSEREALDLFARHYATDSPLPAILLERMNAARTFRAASMQMRQLGFAAVDLALHIDYSPEKDGDVLRYAREILAKHAVAPFPENYAMLASFSHLFGHPVGYAAGYYSYKWAEVLDADAFGRFKAEGVLSQEGRSRVQGALAFPRK